MTPQELKAWADAITGAPLSAVLVALLVWGVNKAAKRIACHLDRQEEALKACSDAARQYLSMPDRRAAPRPLGKRDGK